MKIRNLSLSNYRGFQNLELVFDEKVNVIAGINGVGKSSVLHALRVLYSRALADVAYEKMAAISFTEEDIQNPESQFVVSTGFEIEQLELQVFVQRRFFAQSQRLELQEKLAQAESSAREARQAGDRSSVALANLDVRRYHNLLSELGDRYSRFFRNLPDPDQKLDGLDYVELATQERLRFLKKRKNQDFVVYYSPLRHIFSRVRTLPEGEPLGVEKAFSDALEESEVSFRNFMHWFRWLEQSDDTTTEQKRNSILHMLREVVTTFIPEFTNLRLEEQPKIRLIVDKNNVPLELGQLSDGERGLLALVFDLARRLALANPTIDDPIHEGKAVVLIDELELHLHPSWQRQVLRRLTNTFQNCQFIVTTHSPQIIGEAEPAWVRFLEREDDKIICWTPSQAFGKDTNSILDLMQATPRTEWMTDQLLKLSRLIHSEDFVTARALIKVIQERINGNDPELIRSETLIQFLEGENASHSKE